MCVVSQIKPFLFVMYSFDGSFNLIQCYIHMGDRSRVFFWYETDSHFRFLKMCLLSGRK